MSSFADEFFGGIGVPQMSINDEVVEPFRVGDHVFVEQGGKRYQVVSKYGYWNNSVCDLREVREPEADAS